MLKGKKILVGVTGGIAAYKTATLVRLLIKNGAEVRVVMSPSAKEFITPLTLATLSKNPVISEFFAKDTGRWNSHVDIGLWSDMFVIAPCSANTIAKMANGICDNLLLTTYLSAKCPVAVAPTMDLDMFLHPATQKNIQTLESFGNLIINPSSGELASGLVGKGRMAEPEEITERIIQFFQKKKSRLEGKNLLITAGPTIEKIDPVRFISNFSTGKMGYALAQEAAQRGMSVTLVSGKVDIKINHPNIKVLNVCSADQMYETCKEHYKSCDVAIFSAAVADYKVKNESSKKIKRSSDNYSIELTPNKDIALEMGKMKTTKQLNIGFALETNNEEENAIKKLNKKNLDWVVLNSLNDKNAGFGFDTNTITIFKKVGDAVAFPNKAKTELAVDIFDELEKELSE
jgi:phosphopantothenoylcysteine decarboxylase/phosphopantothenate--cysteine ligase